MGDACDVIARDLSPQWAWPQPPQPEDDAWLSEVARLPAQTWVLRADEGVPARADEEPILVRDLDGWRTGRYIGEIRHRGRTLQIEPRLGVGVITGWIGVAHNVRIIDNTAGTTSDASSLLIQLAAALWRAAMLDAGRHALPRTREHRTSVSYAVEGRLDARATARLRASGDPRIVSARRTRTLENAAAAAVVCADRVLARHLTGNWRGPVVEDQLARMREAVGSRPALPSRDDLRRMRYTPLTARWSRAASLSRRIATSGLLRTSAHDETTSGALIDVAELWELFLVRCVEQATDRLVTHGTRANMDRKLLTSVEDVNRGMGALYPDILVNASAEDGCRVIDAKYKRLSPARPVDREDLYQLAAYAGSFRASRSMLAYPDVGVDAADAERHSPWTGPGTSLFEFRRLPVTGRACTDWLSEWFALPGDAPRARRAVGGT